MNPAAQGDDGVRSFGFSRNAAMYYVYAQSSRIAQQIWQEYKQIQGLAKGGNIMRAGTVKVGEEGPELVKLPRGAQVQPLDGSGGMTINFNGPIYSGGRLRRGGQPGAAPLPAGGERIMARIYTACECEQPGQPP